MLPVFIDLRGRKVVVFGGGRVGFRKASFFAEEAEVTVVSRSFCDEFLNSSLKTLNGEVEKVMTGMIGDADIVVAATDSMDLNKRIVEECTLQGKWCNCATSPGDMIIPSVVRRKGYTVAVSTMGRSQPCPGTSGGCLTRVSRLSTRNDRFAGGPARRGQAELDDQNEGKGGSGGARYEEVWERLRAGDVKGARKRAEERMVESH